MRVVGSPLGGSKGTFAAFSSPHIAQKTPPPKPSLPPMGLSVRYHHLDPSILDTPWLPEEESDLEDALLLRMADQGIKCMVDTYNTVPVPSGGRTAAAYRAVASTGAEAWQ